MHRSSASHPHDSRVRADEPGRLTRRDFCMRLLGVAGAALSSASLFTGRAHAADEAGCAGLEGETIHFIVPAPPGGGFDAVARLIEPFLEKRLGAQIVIENVVGGGTIRGARKISDAKPDGREWGITNPAAMLIALAGGDRSAPDPIDDFTIFGKIAPTPHIWAVGGDSPIHNLEDLYTLSRQRPIVAGVTEFGSTGPESAVIVSRILGIDCSLVPGYQGTNGITLAAIRGEVDIAPLNLEGRTGLMEAGEVRPILWVSSRPRPPALENLACLSGEGGEAVHRARELGRDPKAALEEARALTMLLDTGRVATGPPNLPAALATCLEEHVRRILEDPECDSAAEQARLEIEFTPASRVRAELNIARAAAVQFAPFMEEEARKIEE